VFRADPRQPGLHPFWGNFRVVAHSAVAHSAVAHSAVAHSAVAHSAVAHSAVTLWTTVGVNPSAAIRAS
jgi:hypothetical protein